MSLDVTANTGMAAGARIPLVTATRNAAKLALLASLVGDRHALEPLPHTIEPTEPEPSEIAGIDPLVGIAMAKAVSVSVALGGARTIASDGGLLVPALGDAWQPARTRRFAGPGAINRERAEALLALADGLTGDQRRIGWREAVAFAEAGRIVATFTAEATPGWLAEALPAGWDDNGQGFWVPRLWRGDPGPAPSSGAGSDLWGRLALLVAPYLDGLADRQIGPKGPAKRHWIWR